ncbi:MULTISPECIES: transglycosylase SLT domain-containing protein [unclassified Halomonas]|uniref:transglycosylase SLT domain-containing protein n=1 Tax=unclassified Halomonas TaxID=2609666 RepID=UPI00209FB58D|nr:MULTISPECIES: transglycosylase SLT domain-containing protein [unclassified Halomonas]MCP1312772.1 transglycosylase SLT domain-containing protein [Halomonas sp. 707D7]MCP1326642.1 transglycosylase SLT domain-containing protein [Halomonas sp. 707D4]
MTYRTIRQRFVLSAGSTVIMGLLMAAAANSEASPGTLGSFNASSSTTTPLPSPREEQARAPRLDAYHGHFWDSLSLEPQDVWSVMRQSFQWQEITLPLEAQARVDEWIEHYRARPQNIVEITRRATPWLAWISEQVSERGLPGEIALIPFVESSFDPSAKSHRGAAGLWQFMPGTGDALGLVRNQSYDGRLDVVTSTQAALDYLESQAAEWYQGDIMLSLAAYNAGAGTVNKALRSAQSQGLDGSYWDLSLPSETMQYVPKLKAIATIIQDPERYGVELPDIQATPAFAKVKLENPLSLAEASQLLNVSQRALAELNPGLLGAQAGPRNGQTLLVPESADSELIAELSQSSDRALASTETPAVHRVENGDSLSAIAARYNLDQRDLIRWNALDRPGALTPGQLLALTAR